MMIETPITDHPKLPEGVPLVADFHDDRNRLSYYYPRLRNISSNVTVPVTKFFAVQGDCKTVPKCDCRKITQFMQDISARRGFLRGDFTSAKLDREGSVLKSQDPYDINETFAVFVKNVIMTERHIGGRIAVRDFIPHDEEIRYFIDDGDVLYHQSISGVNNYPENQIQSIAHEFNQLSWSVDFIRHEKTGEWYCIDMGLNGLYPNNEGSWVAISEHPNKDMSPENYSDSMPNPDRLKYIR
jgi:hypothetical protein